MTPLRLHVAPGNTKLGRVPNVSLRPVLDCVNCSTCKRDCYALKAWRQYPSVRKAWTANSVLLRNYPDTFETRLSAYLDRRKPRMFRWNVAGDIINPYHYGMICRIAERFPRTRFLIFTKAFGNLYKRIIPANLSVVASVWQGMPADHVDARLPLAFAGDCSAYGKRFERAIACPGRCDACGVCWDLAKRKLDVKFEIH